MTREDLFRAVGEVREEQITDAEEKQNRLRRRYGILAACLALVLAGALALERLEDARRWTEPENGFQAADSPESAPDAGGGEDEDRWGAKIVEFNPEESTESGACLDGQSYWNSEGKRPGYNYSVNVEIGEADSGAQEANGPAADAGKNRTEIETAACLAWLSPEEIFARDTVIFRGTVRELRHYEVYEVSLKGSRYQYTAAAVEVTDPIRGDVYAGQIRTILYPGGPGMSTSLSGPLEDLKVGSEAVFMPEPTSGETGVGSNGCYFCYADLTEFYLSEGLRFVFADTGNGLDFERGAYPDIADAETLDEVAAYIRQMIGEAEQSRPAEVPAEPQRVPAETDPALLDPSYGVKGPNGAREQPGS